MSPLTESTRLTLAKSFTQQAYMWEFPQQYGLWYPGLISTALWLDAADAPTVTTVGGAVSQWNDKSGNARHATQGTAGNRPLLAAAGLNGKAVIDCDGTNDELSLANITSLTSVNQSLFVVAKRDNAAGRTEMSIAIGNTTTSDGVIDIPRWTDNAMYSQVGYATNRPTPTSVITDQPYISSVTGGAIQLSYTNGTLIGTGTTQSTSSFSVTSGFIGSGTAVTPSGRFFDGKIAEIVLLPLVADTTTRQKTEGYLAHKWGLTANLPAGHPYKTIGPTP
jgi:hypothetical protein